MRLPRDLTEYAIQVWPPGDMTVAPRDDAADGITVVTAFFDIRRGDWRGDGSEVAGKYERSIDEYFAYFSILAHLKNHMVIFTDPHLAGRVRELRQNAGLDDRTVIFTIDQMIDCPSVQPTLTAIKAQMTDGFRGFVWRPGSPEYNKADYVLINALKTTFANTAIDRQAVKTRQLAWIDFGYTRQPETFARDTEWRFDAGDKINLFNIFRLDNRPIYDIVRGGEVYFQGCHIIGPVSAWETFNNQIADALQSLIDCNLIDDDQTLMLMAWRRHPDSFTVRRRRIDPDYDWRFIFRRFRTGLTPVDEELPDVREIRQPSWWRDLKNDVRRQIKKWRRHPGRG